MNKRKYFHHPLFDRSNFMLMLIGIAIMVLGYIMMIGGGYTDSVTPNYDVKYGFRTTILAPFLILLGLAINGYAIMKKPSQERSDWVEQNVFTQKDSIVSERRRSLDIDSKPNTVVDRKPIGSTSESPKTVDNLSKRKSNKKNKKA